MLKASTALLLQAAFAVGYVSSIYIHPNGRLRFHSTVDGKTTATRSRNDPTVIKTRLTAVCIATLASCLAVVLAVWTDGEGEDQGLSEVLSHSITLLGLAPSAPSIRRILPYLIVPLLYAGPLFTVFLSSGLPLQRQWSFKRDVVETFSTYRGLRNYLVAPITEELVFRASIIAIGTLSHQSNTKIIFLSPLWFGVAHAHHAWESFNTLGRTKSAFVNALLIALVQLAYTTAFGWFTSFLFVRTSSAYATSSAHMFCNFMGLPTVNRDMQEFPRYKYTIWMMHLMGIIGFAVVLFPWTSV